MFDFFRVADKEGNQILFRIGFITSIYYSAPAGTILTTSDGNCHVLRDSPSVVTADLEKVVQSNWKREQKGYAELPQRKLYEERTGKPLRKTETRE